MLSVHIHTANRTDFSTGSADRAPTQKYHSIHAKGGSVDDILGQAE